VTGYKPDAWLRACAAGLFAAFAVVRIVDQRPAAGVSVSCAAGALMVALAWLYLRIGKQRQVDAAGIFADSWPMWLGLIWVRELLPMRPLVSMVLLSGFLCGLGLRIGLRASPVLMRRPEMAPRRINAVSWILCLIFTAAFTIQPWLKYHAFYSFWMDLGYMAHPIWNTAHGRLFQFATLDGQFGSSLADHFSPIFGLIAPLFLVAPFMMTLFFVQAAGGGVAGVVLHRLLVKWGFALREAVLLQAAFYLYIPLQFGMISDFHADPLAIPWIMLLIYAAAMRRFRILIVAAIVTLLCKEHMGFALAPLLLVLAFRLREWRGRLVIMAGVACLYSVAVEVWAIPYFNHGRETMALAYTFPGGEQGIGGVVAWMAGHPSGAIARLFSPHNFEQLAWILLPALFLPVMIPEALSLSFMAFKEMYGQFALYNHHAAYMAPLVFWCAAIWLRNRNPARRLAVVVAIVWCSAATSVINGESPLSHRFWRMLRVHYWADAHARVLQRALRSVPPGASLSADSHIAVHCFARRKLYLFPRPFPADSTAYIAVDGKKFEWGTEIQRVTWRDRGRAAVLDNLRRLANSGRYDTVFADDGVVVLKKR
jgi:uncharacterized membrane protein